MGSILNKDKIRAMKSVLGCNVPEMEIVRALYMANDDVNRAINMYLDAPAFHTKKDRTSAAAGARLSVAIPAAAADTGNNPTNCVKSKLPLIPPPPPAEQNPQNLELSLQNPQKLSPQLPVAFPKRSFSQAHQDSGSDSEVEEIPAPLNSVAHHAAAARPQLIVPAAPSKRPVKWIDGSGSDLFEGYSVGSDWWLLGCVQIDCACTCMKSKVRLGEAVQFSFPNPHKRLCSSSSSAGYQSIRKSVNAVRFSTSYAGEIGRLPADWTKCLLPLVNGNIAKIHGFIVAAPEEVSFMDSVFLSVGIYIDHMLLETPVELQRNLTVHSSNDSTTYPLPTLFRMLGKTPFKRAEFTPEDLSHKQRALNLKGDAAPALPGLKRQKSSKGSAEEDEVLSDADLNKLVGSSESCHLEEMDPPETLLYDLRCYQKQALCWMNKMEKGTELEKAANSIHPCWDAYKISDRRASAVYVNAFTGAATTKFPSALTVTRGGILADAMGLGKTVMTISLILSSPGKGGSEYMPHVVSLSSSISNGQEISSTLKRPATDLQVVTVSETQNRYEKHKNQIHRGGGTLVVCPMTLLGQWQTEFETHASHGSLSVYVHYGQSRWTDPRELLKYDVVLTTYDVLSSARSSEKNQEASVLHSIHWFRIVLDEAHTIKSSNCQVSQAAFDLTADCRWCLTGTPIQNKLEDVHSLLHFLRIEPWGNWAWWQKLIQKPDEEGDERGLNLVKAILSPLMLRRTEDSLDKDGRQDPIPIHFSTNMVQRPVHFSDFLFLESQAYTCSSSD